MMTLEEKIEVIKAYAEGKAVEVYDEDSDEWFAKQRNVWDFEEGKYRIKPKETAKFAVGDVLVFTRAAETSNPTMYKVIGIQQDYYEFNNMTPRPIEGVDIGYANIKDVLWYFEIYDYATKKYSMHPTRMTMAKMDEEFGTNHDTLSWKPMYSLGFKLKED